MAKIAHTNLMSTSPRFPANSPLMNSSVFASCNTGTALHHVSNIIFLRTILIRLITGFKSVIETYHGANTTDYKLYTAAVPATPIFVANEFQLTFSGKVLTKGR